MKDLKALKEQYAKLGQEIEALENEKKLPSTWGEYCKNNPDKVYYDGFDILPDRFIQGLPNKYVALRKLELLRDCYNDGWVANWNDRDSKKYCICFNGWLTHYLIAWGHRRFLHFKTEELRSLFLGNFADLIEEAKELL